MKTSEISLVINDDASTFLFSDDNLGREELEAYLKRYKESGVDLLSYCVSFASGLCYYETDKFEKFCSGFEYSDNSTARRTAVNMRNMRERHGGYIKAVFEILEDLKIPYMASFRMNDCHMMGGGAFSCFSSRFWANNPGFRLGEATYGYYGGALDYSFREVRSLYKELVRETVSKFPGISGIELDFMRSPFFFQPGEGVEKAHLITELIADIKKMLGDSYLISVNVPNSPQLALESGLDVKTWSEQGLVDMAASGAYLVDMQVPVSDWKKILRPETKIFLYANCSQQMGQYMSFENYCAAASNCFAAGGDGLYLFNFCCYDELTQMALRPKDSSYNPSISMPHVSRLPDIDKVRENLPILKRRDELKNINRHYLFYMQEKLHRHYPDGPMEIENKIGSRAEIPFVCHEAFGNAKNIKLRFKLSHVERENEFSVSLNGKHMSKDSMNLSYAPRGRDVRLHPVRLAPYFLFEFSPGSALKEGENSLEISVEKANELAPGKIEFSELEIIVNY